MSRSDSCRATVLALPYGQLSCGMHLLEMIGLAGWLTDRSGALVMAIRDRRWYSAYEELLMLRGTMVGMLLGLLVGTRQR